MTATGADVTRVTEDYLALIWKACEWPDDGRRPNTTDLAAPRPGPPPPPPPRQHTADYLMTATRGGPSPHHISPLTGRKPREHG